MTDGDADVRLDDWPPSDPHTDLDPIAGALEIGIDALGFPALSAPAAPDFPAESLDLAVTLAPESSSPLGSFGTARSLQFFESLPVPCLSSFRGRCLPVCTVSHRPSSSGSAGGKARDLGFGTKGVEDCFAAAEEEGANGVTGPFGDVLLEPEGLLVFSLMRSAYDPKALKTEVCANGVGDEPDMLREWASGGNSVGMDESEGGGSCIASIVSVWLGKVRQGRATRESVGGPTQSRWVWFLAYKVEGDSLLDPHFPTTTGAE